MRRKSVAIERHPPVIEIGNLVPGERLAHLRARHAIDEEPESGRDCHHGPDGPMSARLSPVGQSLIGFNQSPAREAGKPVARTHPHRDAVDVDVSPLGRSDYGVVVVVVPVEMTAGTAPVPRMMFLRPYAVVTVFIGV
jgi:hypothetical protein